MSRAKRPNRILSLLLVLFSILAFTVGAADPSIAGPSAYAAPGASTFGVASPQSSSPYGVAGVMRWPDWGTFGRPADAMLETGGSWIREDFAWGLIEPREGQQNWTPTDRIVQNLRDRNLNILGILAYSANWATPAKEDDASPDAVSMYPPDLAKYYNWVRTLVSRYKGKVGYWEVWNEPDNAAFWKP
ncbi:MAG TPA: beta-galactosidase, partial [Chloroflexia bacterium]|nr:beta-galactosidase [Chloroflexia bacterium]